jgi:hypothetical protein
MADRQAAVDARLSRLTGGFARYLTAYDELVPFSSEQLPAHHQCIALRQQAGSLTAAVSDPRFVASLRRTYASRKALTRTAGNSGMDFTIVTPRDDRWTE